MAEKRNCSTGRLQMVSRPTEPQFRRGDIWLVDFGSEPEHPEQAFRRPAVVVSDDRLHLPSLKIVVVVPGTSTLRHLPLHVEVDPTDDNGLSRPTAFQAEQIRAVSSVRLIERIGRLEGEHCHSLDEILRNTLSL